MSHSTQQITEKILNNQNCSPFLLLIEYEQILQHKNQIVASKGNLKQRELFDLGLIAEEEGYLKVSSPIYELKFNQNWINEQLPKLRPYYQQLNAWIQSECQDQEKLLTEQKLRQTLAWVQDKIDYLRLEHELEFLVASQVLDRFFNKPDFKFLLTDQEIEAIKNAQQLANKVSNPITFMEEVFLWTGEEAFLISKVCQLIVDSESSISNQEDKLWLPELIESNLIGNNADSEILQYRQEKSDRILEDQDSAINVLREYQKILRSSPSSPMIFTGSFEQQKLIKIGLLLNQQGNLKVANLIHEKLFDHNWVEKELQNLIPPTTLENNSTPSETLAKTQSLEAQTKASKHYKNIALILIIGFLSVGIYSWLFKYPDQNAQNDPSAKLSNTCVDEEVGKFIDEQIIPGFKESPTLRESRINRIKIILEQQANNLDQECRNLVNKKFDELLNIHIKGLIYDQPYQYKEAITYICYLSEEYENLGNFSQILINWSEKNYIPQDVKQKAIKVIKDTKSEQFSCPAVAIAEFRMQN